MAFPKLLEFLGFFRESKNVFSKNGKLMTSITLLTLSVTSLLYLLNTFAMKPLLKDLSMDVSLLMVATPGSPEFANLIINLKKDFGFLFGLEWICFLVGSLAALFLLSLTVLASAIALSGKNNQTHCRDLLAKALTSWKRLFVTWFFTGLLSSGYFILVLFICLPLLLTSIAPAAMALGALAYVFYIYLSVVWTLSLVTSTIEDVSGIEALGKAAKIIKGSRVHGFGLNLLFSVIAGLIMQGIRLIGTHKSMVGQVGIGLTVVIFVCLVRMVWLVALTALYFHCKKVHGERVEIFGEVVVEYTKISGVPLIGEDIA